MASPNLFKVCRHISPDCPVESSIYGYYPSLPGNTFFLAWFAAMLIVNVLLGVKFKRWAYMTAVSLGCISEVIGYAGWVILHNNPYSKAGFDMQIVCLVIAPAFFAAGIYLMLKHLTLFFGPSDSPINPRLYTWIFISCDVVSLILQGAGGGISATADSYATQRSGNNVALAGIVFQVFTLLIFAGMAALYWYRCQQRLKGHSKHEEDADAPETTRNVQVYMFSLVFAYLCILTRCGYRIAEMADGWRNPIMLSETYFMVCDGAMIALSTATMVLCHPGLYFA
jgi:hypothetical protein